MNPINAHNTQEFATLSEDAKIYKLVGPVLLKQEPSEAKSTVDGRLEFIANEMYMSLHSEAGNNVRRLTRSLL